MGTDDLSDEEVFGEWRTEAVECCLRDESFGLTQLEIDGLRYWDTNALRWITLYSDRGNRPFLAYEWGDASFLSLLTPQTGARVLLPHLIAIVDRLKPYFLDPGWETLSQLQSWREGPQVGLDTSLMIIGFELFCTESYGSDICRVLTEAQRLLVLRLIELLLPRIDYLYKEMGRVPLETLRDRVKQENHASGA